MGTVFIILLGLFLNSNSEAAKMSGSIHHLDFGDQLGDETLVYLSNGRVLRLANFNLPLVEKMQRGILKNAWFSFSVTPKNEVIDLIESKPVLKRKSPKATRLTLVETYQPSIIGSMEKARTFFYESLPSPQDSQCFNRAHVWAHEWRIKHNLYSNKIWLFFTRKYIRQFAFDWWFHVSPYVHVVEDGKVRERVMDMKYGRGPIKLKQWTDIFLRNNAPCPLVEKYSDQANYPEWGSCFTMKSSMYYYQPVDLEWKEVFGAEKNTWIPAEIIEAYREAFSIELKEANI